MSVIPQERANPIERAYEHQRVVESQFRKNVLMDFHKHVLAELAASVAFHKNVLMIVISTFLWNFRYYFAVKNVLITALSTFLRNDPFVS